MAGAPSRSLPYPVKFVGPEEVARSDCQREFVFVFKNAFGWMDRHKHIPYIILMFQISMLSPH